MLFRSGYVGYYYSMKGWICIDDPENKEVTTGKDVKEEKSNIVKPVVPPKDILTNQKKEFTSTEVLLTVLVAGVLLLTSLLIIKLKKHSVE